VKYSIRKASRNDPKMDVWEVLKTPVTGDPYLIATFHDPTIARWCLGTFHGSMEVQREAGSVEEYPIDQKPVCSGLMDDVPDELVW
jgi:hypothetical protein